MNLALAAEWYPERYVYLLGGLNFAFTLSKSIDYKRKILLPDNYVFENGSNTIKLPGTPETLESINSFKVGLFLGFGFTYPVNKRINIFGETHYNLYLNNIIDDGGWKLHQISLILGAKYLL